MISLSSVWFPEYDRFPEIIFSYSPKFPAEIVLLVTTSITPPSKLADKHYRSNSTESKTASSMKTLVLSVQSCFSLLNLFDFIFTPTSSTAEKMNVIQAWRLGLDSLLVGVEICPSFWHCWYSDGSLKIVYSYNVLGV